MNREAEGVISAVLLTSVIQKSARASRIGPNTKDSLKVTQWSSGTVENSERAYMNGAHEI